MPTDGFDRRISLFLSSENSPTGSLFSHVCVDERKFISPGALPASLSIPTTRQVMDDLLDTTRQVMDDLLDTTRKRG
jgi:hypothetical protein